MRNTRMYLFTLLLALLVLGGASASIATAGGPAPAATPAPAAVSREVINEGSPASAPGEVLQLVRYVIPPNFGLPAHTHPGMQVNTVVSGTLHYVVVDGSATYTRASDPSVVQTLTSGQEIDFQPGDSFVEPEGMIHYGQNRTSRTVILLTASLFAAGQPPSTIVKATPVP